MPQPSEKEGLGCRGSQPVTHAKQGDPETADRMARHLYCILMGSMRYWRHWQDCLTSIMLNKKCDRNSPNCSFFSCQQHSHSPIVPFIKFCAFCRKSIMTAKCGGLRSTQAGSPAGTPGAACHIRSTLWGNVMQKQRGSYHHPAAQQFRTPESWQTRNRWLAPKLF